MRPYVYTWQTLDPGVYTTLGRAASLAYRLGQAIPWLHVATVLRDPSDRSGSGSPVYALVMGTQRKTNRDDWTRVQKALDRLTSQDAALYASHSQDIVETLDPSAFPGSSFRVSWVPDWSDVWTDATKRAGPAPSPESVAGSELYSGGPR